MKYTVSARSLQIHTGVLVLTAAQAGPRMHNLKDLGRSRYEVLRPVEFKLGEQIGYEGELPKTLALMLDDEARVQQKANAQHKAAAAKKSKAVHLAKPDDADAADGE